MLRAFTHSTSRSRVALALPLFMAGLLMAACGQGAAYSGQTSPTSGGGAAATTRTVTVMLSEYSVQPNTASVPAGSTTFVVMNHGSMVHELVVLQTDLASAALKMEAGGNEVDEDASGQKIGEIQDIDPGSSKTGAFVLGPGRYVLFCNQPGHYQQGMTASLQVN